MCYSRRALTLSRLRKSLSDGETYVKELERAAFFFFFFFLRAIDRSLPASLFPGEVNWIRTGGQREGASDRRAMAGKENELCESLIIWLQTFNTSAPCKTIGDLSSGVTMAQILHQIDSSHFDDSWLARIKEDVGDNRRIKINNLKKILQRIVDYYHEVLGQPVSEYLLPDLSQIAEHSDSREMGRFLQLILGCAINCDQKEEHIQIIMTLEESVQHVVMTAIQELMSKDSVDSPTIESPGDLELQMKRTLELLHEAVAEKEELKQRCRELDLQVAGLQEERNSLLAENEFQNERLNQLDPFDESSTVVTKKYFQIQLDQLQEENYRLEAAKDEYRAHCELLEKQLIETQNRNDELANVAEESRALKDEIDVLRATADKATKLESTMESYRKKLEDFNDLRRQVKSLEDTNLMYMHNTVSLEEDLKKASAARTQLETYKRQVQDLHTKLSMETKRADTLAYDMSRLQEKQDALVKEKERLIIQRDALKETNEELRCSLVQQDHLNQSGESGFKSKDNLAAELLPVEYREMFIRLQHENKMLRVQQEGSENKHIADLQVQLEEKQRKMSELETENRLTLGRVEELQLQIADLQKTLQNQGTEAEGTGSNTLKMKIEAQMEKLKEVNDALETKKELLDDLKPDADQSAQRIEELEAALHKKDEDMKAMEDRYKIYLEKARNVIKTLDPKLNPASAEIMLLRKQMTEKDRRIEILERDCAQAKLREYEEQLIVTAWYNKSIEHQKLAMESRLAGRGGRDSGAGSSGRSFLAQQRHVTNSRRSAAVTVHSASPN
ncbi:protein Hook homolog 1 isoform X2 [Pseudophryne corroboree]|uniref:protein Hook homolog 1 isoform X2 n=1 Tax=Pseudophryne corroboree TaxID=495146 RepID=UPI0030818AEC